MYIGTSIYLKNKVLNKTAHTRHGKSEHRLAVAFLFSTAGLFLGLAC